jgi:hypothetical protein
MNLWISDRVKADDLNEVSADVEVLKTVIQDKV